MPSAVQFVDCRLDLQDEHRGLQLYRAGHLPGAVHVDVAHTLCDLSVPLEIGGRHPLPTADQFGRVIGGLGIGSDTAVAAYDDDTFGAARLWWLLRHFGHGRAGVLKRALKEWAGPIETGDETPKHATFHITERDDDIIGEQEIYERLSDDRLVLVDARSPERYSGQCEPVDQIPGHIPGAINIPYHNPDVARVAAEAQEIAVYCGSGLSATVVLLELTRHGRDDARLYPGSWSAWSRRGLPVAVGAEPLLA